MGLATRDYQCRVQLNWPIEKTSGLELAETMDHVFDITVVGAGIEGSATAYQLSKMASGKKIALVEQVGQSFIVYLMWDHAGIDRGEHWALWSNFGAVVAILVPNTNS